MKRVAVLGSTGSIGRSALQVLENLAPEFVVFAISGKDELDLLSEQAGKHKPALVSIGDESLKGELARRVPGRTEVLSGGEALTEIASCSDVDIVVNGLVGSVGFRPTLAALRAGKRVALANKEPLVSYGSILTAEARRSGAEIIAIDSEHSAIHQAMGKSPGDEVSRIILTASGGPFLNAASLDSITPKEALAHPTWEMGEKVTVDSATLMNKGLEVIEARWLFNIDPSKIEVVIHPQSIVHSIVEFVDGSCIAQLSTPDMKLPIQYAITYPRRMESLTNKLDLAEVAKLEFFRPDFSRFPCLDLAYDAIRKGGTMPAVLSASDEIAVAAFLKGEIGFTQIPQVLQEVLSNHTSKSDPTLEEAEAADHWAREEAARAVNRLSSRHKM
ncbi:1-deoxy-D-xylulose-5-phosphate reductoisomerase [candidate division TA06 bacterium]|uniref:1-deoxy-D-xylulose 5-phosphate reductoisomerase n=1 Tax=candidate division TA06 bacterium TaxID=2250710 RepID=A0A523UTT5_UNCT6|nr:MAG: 1-deoxy-D-xylulose-5-phosphate reductoisomerase [candidate division TA06 bacterium]